MKQNRQHCLPVFFILLVSALVLPLREHRIDDKVAEDEGNVEGEAADKAAYEQQADATLADPAQEAQVALTDAA